MSAHWKGAAALVGVLAAFGAPLAGADDPSGPFFHVDDPSRMGRPIRVVTPEFPKPALDQRLAAIVDVEGRISPLHSLQEVTLRVEPPGADVFVEAVKKVLPYWEFHPIFEGGCFPTERRVANRVSFEWDGDQPKIFVTVRPAPAQKKRESIRVVKRVEPTYPREAISAGHQAYVYSELAVLPDGSVSGVKTRTYPERPGTANQAFEREAIRKLSQWMFEPATVPLRSACQEIIFQFRD